MRLLYALITCLAISGAAVIEMVDVQKGGNITLLVTTPGLGNVRRVTVGKCENGTGDIFRYCSPEEMDGGCPVDNSERFSIHFDNASASVTFLDARASDEGCYVVKVIDGRNDVKKTMFNVKVNGVSHVPETPRIDGPFTISLEYLCIIAGVIAIGIMVVYSIAVIICLCQKKKKKKSDAGDRTKDPEVIALSSIINGEV